MTWLQPPMRLPLVLFVVVLLLAASQRAGAQEHSLASQPVAHPQPPASAPTSQALKPGQGPPPVPEPTVVLKPGEVPGIKFKEPTYEFGRVRSGTDVTHDFEFTNTGNGPLEILQVKPG